MPEQKVIDRPLRGLRILVVDDNDDARDLLVMLLVLHGATVDSAPSATEALESVRSRRPDILVSDLTMPGEDGWSLMRKVREIDATIPGVALSGVEADDLGSLKDVGFIAHMTKPADPQKLIELLTDLGRKLASASASST